MADMFFQDQKQKEQAQLKLKMDSELFFQTTDIGVGLELLSEKYTYFEKTESVLTKSIPKEAKIDQAAVMSPQEISKKSKDEKELNKKALAVSEKERLFKSHLREGLAPEAAESKELMELKIDTIKQGLVVSEQNIKEHYEPLINREKDKKEKEKLEKEYDLALKKARFESARDIGKAASYYVETLKAAEASEEALIDACAYKEDLLVEADALERSYRASSIVNEKEREREEHTVKKHYWYDVLKGIFRKKNPYSHEGAVIEREGRRYVNVGRAFFGGTKAMYIFEDRSDGAGVTDENGIIHYPQFLYKEATNCIGMDKPEGALATEAAANIQKLISGDYAIDAFAIRDKDGKVCGSLQRKVDKYDAKTGGTPDVNLYSWQEAPETSISNGQGDEVDKQIKSEVLREHTLDWILCNFDTKGENFIYRKDKHLSSFDKEASFTYLKDPGSATMSLDYMPHTHNTIYNVLFTSFVEGKQDLDFAVIEENIRKVEEIVGVNGGADYMAYFKDMLDQKYGPESPKNKKRQEAYDLILKRATDIRETYSIFLGQLIVQRNKYIKEHDLAVDNPYMTRIEYVNVEGSENPVPRFMFSESKTALTSYNELIHDRSAQIHLENLERTPESLAELKRATDAVLERYKVLFDGTAEDNEDLPKEYKKRVSDIHAKILEQKKRLDGYSQEDINSGVWLDKEKGFLIVKDLPDMESDLFEKLYQAQLKKFNNDETYTRNRHYVRACEFQLKRFQDKTQEFCYHPKDGSGFLAETHQMFDRAKTGRALRSDIPHLERLKSAFIFVEQMLKEMMVFQVSDPVIAELNSINPKIHDPLKAAMSNPLRGDINLFFTNAKMTIRPIWNLLVQELQFIGIAQLEDSMANWSELVTSGVMSESIDQLISMAQNTELANSPQWQEKAYSSERIEADKLSKARLGTDQSMSDEEAKLRLDDMEVDDTVTQARYIAYEMEARTQRRLDELKENGDNVIVTASGLKIPVERLIGDYTASSNNIRVHILGSEVEDKTMSSRLDSQIRLIDKALEKMAPLRSEPMTTYRYAAYKDSERMDLTTSNPFGDTIIEGDIVMDIGFCSTSAGKRFIRGHEGNSQTVTSFVRMSITGTSGVPIADPNGSYSNLKKGPTEAGQSEVLYPRNTCFRVVKIRNDGEGDTKVSGVVLEEVKKADLPKGQVIKDIYTGAPITE